MSVFFTRVLKLICLSGILSSKNKRSDMNRSSRMFSSYSLQWKRVLGLRSDQWKRVYKVSVPTCELDFSVQH